MNEYTTNQPIGSTVSDHDITHRIHNGKCLDCECEHGDKTEQMAKYNGAHCLCPHHGVNMNKPCSEDDPKCPFHPSDDFTKRDGTLTPLGEALQANCPRCNMRWIIHNCPKYPKLLDAKEMIKKLARGAVLQELAENADYFTSIKQDGEEFNVYVRENNKI